MNVDKWVTLGPWEHFDSEGWKHCGRAAWVDDDGVTCENCRAVIAGTDDDEQRYGVQS